MQPNDPNEGFFDGVIGMVKTYGKALDDNEVSKLYTDGHI